MFSGENNCTLIHLKKTKKQEATVSFKVKICCRDQVFKPRVATELNPPHVSLQLVRWATSSPSQALFPAQSARPTAEPARKDRRHVNAAAPFIGQPVMPTPQPAQVSFVSLFAYAWFSGRRSRGLPGHLLLTLTVGTETYSH